MNITELITYTRYLLAESTASLWTNSEIGDYINQAYAHCYRTQVMKDRGYGAVVFDWDSSVTGIPSATKMKDGEWRILIPKFFYKVLELQDGTENYATIPSSARSAKKPGTWHFSGSNYITLYQTQEPTNLRFHVYRNPARLFSGSLTSVSGASGVLNPGTGTVSKEPWEYMGSIVQMTNGTAKGCILNVIDYNFLSELITWESIGDSTGVSTGDTMALVPDMDDTHHEILAFLAADRAFTKEGNLAGKQLIQPNIAQLLQDFVTNLVPRTTDRPRFVESPSVSTSNTYDNSPITPLP